VTVDRDVHLVLPSGTTAHFANDSCEANLAVHEVYSFAANRPVAADEELTVDYATISGARPARPMPVRRDNLSRHSGALGLSP
jgi:SET domain